MRDIGVTVKGKLLDLRYGQEVVVAMKDGTSVTGFIKNIHADGWQLEYITVQTGPCIRVLCFGRSIEDITIQ